MSVPYMSLLGINWGQIDGVEWVLGYFIRQEITKVLTSCLLEIKTAIIW